MSWFGWGKKKKGEGEEDEKDEHADEKKDPQQGDDGQEGEEDDEEPLPQCEALGEADPRKLDYKSEEKVLARTEALRELIAEHYAAQVKAGEMESADVPTPGDAELRRFLRARKYKPPKSLQLFIQERAWRRENHIDQITAAVDAGEMAYQYIAPHRHHNFDRLGRPVYIEKTGLVRMQNLLKHRSANDCVWRHVRSVEQILHRMRESTAADLGGHGHAVEQQVVIMDLKGLSFKIDFTALGVFKRTIDIDQKYYPERLGKLFMINAPWIFKSYWAVIKHFVDARTKAKVCVYVCLVYSSNQSFICVRVCVCVCACSSQSWAATTLKSSWRSSTRSTCPRSGVASASVGRPAGAARVCPQYAHFPPQKRKKRRRRRRRTRRRKKKRLSTTCLL
jgi:hypothetical protein